MSADSAPNPALVAHLLEHSVRTGDFNADKQQLGFGYKFQVLERTVPFEPEDFPGLVGGGG